MSKLVIAGHGAVRARRKFLRYFPDGFRDETYLDWERNYKWKGHVAWNELLAPAIYRSLLREKRYEEIAARAVRIESRTNLLFSFEKMAIRDALKTSLGARVFARGLWNWLRVKPADAQAFDAWCNVVRELPRRQTRVLTWPVVTVFGFLARPSLHFFFKPMVTRRAARRYGFDLAYSSKPSFEIYSSLLEFADRVRKDVKDLRPRDMIDIQSYVWLQGSDEYP